MKRLVRFPKGDPHTPSWWHTRLETDEPLSDDFMAKCPAHPDNNPSLHISGTQSGSVVHDFAGCAYEAILEAVESPGDDSSVDVRGDLTGTVASITATPKPTPLISFPSPASASPLTWLSLYTGIPREALEGEALEERLGKIRFIFEGVDKFKERTPGSKGWSWVGGGRTPPFWPVPSSGISSSIVITEGETDALVARYLGADAYAYTGGANNPPDVLAFAYLKSLGVDKVIVIPDLDAPGAEGGSAIVVAAENAGLKTDVLDLAPHTIPVFGEKDLRDVFRRLGREETVLRLSLSLDLVVDLGEDGEDYIASARDEITWISKPLLAESTVSLLAGQPKAGKTTLLFQLIDALASGRMFLGHPTRPARIFYMTEDSRIQIKAKKRDQMRGSLSHVVILDRYDKRLVTKTW